MVEKYCRVGQATDDMWRILIVCWIPTPKRDTENKYYLLLSHSNNGCTNAIHCYGTHTLPVLLIK